MLHSLSLHTVRGPFSSHEGTPNLVVWGVLLKSPHVVNVGQISHIHLNERQVVTTYFLFLRGGRLIFDERQVVTTSYLFLRGGTLFFVVMLVALWVDVNA